MKKKQQNLGIQTRNSFHKKKVSYVLPNNPPQPPQQSFALELLNVIRAILKNLDDIFLEKTIQERLSIRLWLVIRLVLLDSKSNREISTRLELKTLIDTHCLFHNEPNLRQLAREISKLDNPLFRSLRNTIWSSIFRLSHNMLNKYTKKLKSADTIKKTNFFYFIKRNYFKKNDKTKFYLKELADQINILHKIFHQPLARVKKVKLFVKNMKSILTLMKNSMMFCLMLTKEQKNPILYEELAEVILKGKELFSANKSNFGAESLSDEEIHDMGLIEKKLHFLWLHAKIHYRIEQEKCEKKPKHTKQALHRENV